MAGDGQMSGTPEPSEGTPPEVAPEVLAALRSTPKRAVMQIFMEADGVLSAKDVANLSRQSLGATAHHVRGLSKIGLLKWAGEKRVRGALQTFYCPSDLAKQVVTRQAPVVVRIEVMDGDGRVVQNDQRMLVYGTSLEIEGDKVRITRIEPSSQ